MVTSLDVRRKRPQFALACNDMGMIEPVAGDENAVGLLLAFEGAPVVALVGFDQGFMVETSEESQQVGRTGQTRLMILLVRQQDTAYGIGAQILTPLPAPACVCLLRPGRK